MTFLDLGVNRKVVDNDVYYINMDFQPNRDKNTRENGQKPSKMAKNGLKTVFLPYLTNFPDLGVNRKVVDNG